MGTGLDIPSRPQDTPTGPKALHRRCEAMVAQAVPSGNPRVPAPLAVGLVPASGRMGRTGGAAGLRLPAGPQGVTLAVRGPITSTSGSPTPSGTA